MYLQMDRNALRKLESNEDFEGFAKSTYHIANEYFHIADHCLTILVQNPAAVLSIAAFSCELFLKSIIYWTVHKKCYKNGKNGAEEHDLLNLFKMLPIEIANKIKELHPCSNTKKEKFEIELSNIRKAFTILRYISEHSSMACNMIFILELLASLKSVCDDLLSDK